METSAFENKSLMNRSLVKVLCINIRQSKDNQKGEYKIIALARHRNPIQDPCLGNSTMIQLIRAIAMSLLLRIEILDHWKFVNLSDGELGGVSLYTSLEKPCEGIAYSTMNKRQNLYLIFNLKSQIELSQ